MAQTYFTLAARSMSVRKVPMVALNFPGVPPSGPGLQFGNMRRSTHSHIHGSNRNRIALHVMLNDSRNRTRC